MTDFIQGNKFKSLAKFSYAPPPKLGGRIKNNFVPNDYRYLVSTLDIRQLNENDIIYTHTFFADYLFEKVNKPFILITHNADTPVNIEPPSNVKIWFTTNVTIQHERIRSIPIGIENNFWLKDKAAKMERKLLHKKEFKNMIYINHNIKTNPAKRQKPYDILQGQKWVTTNRGANGEGFDNYLDNIYNHPFVVCPEGNGVDTHRVWECLYMKTIPVCTKNINNQFYTDLPILFIDDWEEITEKFLFDKYKEMAGMKWNLDKLNFSWWKREILNT